MNTQDRLIKVSQLNKIYRKVLGRDADQSGINSYLHILHNKNGMSQVEQILMSSDEYKARRKKTDSDFNSLSGDRSSYINRVNQEKIDRTAFKNTINSILKLIALLEYPDYTEKETINRIGQIKSSLIHIADNNLSFTIFPHLEQNLNRETFETSLLDNKNFQYFVLFVATLNLWKKIFNKTVATCGTTKIVSVLNKPVNNFDSLWRMIGLFIIDYLSIRFIGQQLSNEQKNLFQNDYTKLVPFLIDKQKSEKLTEKLIIEQNIRDLTIDLGRKPKVLIMVAYLETQNSKLIDQMLYHINLVKQYNPLLDIEFALDNERVDKHINDYTPWSRVKRIRNLMIDKYPINNYDYLYWIDSDIIDYPADFLSAAIGLNPKGITAPLSLIQYSTVFYDWCGYQKLNATSLYSKYGKNILEKACDERNFSLSPPYIEDSSKITKIDCVGCTYVVPTSIFSKTYGELQQELLDVFDLAGVADHKIHDNIVQYEDHPSFTDHYTVCAAVRANGGDVCLYSGSVAYHADLPLYGENWH
jgi:hypothetical protein